MKYTLIRQRRKTVALTVEDNGDLTVKAPIKTSQKFIEDFILSKRAWIDRQKKKNDSINNFKLKFNFKKRLYILGEAYKFEDVDLSFIKPRSNDIIKFYQKLAGKKLPEFVKELVTKTKLKCKSVKLSSSRRIWGSFDRNFNMKLNWRLIILPKPLIDYIIIHELCHGIELNHSKAFWSNVEKHCPDYKQRKKELALYTFVLSFDEENL